MTNNEEYYLNLCLPPIPTSPEDDLFQYIDGLENEQDKERLVSLFKKVLDAHQRRLLEASKKNVSQQLNQSMRETQHYKRLYENQRRVSSYTTSSCSSSSVRYSTVDDPVSSETESLTLLLPLTDHHNENSQDSFSIPSEDILTFACGDGFWNTIAHGKSNKGEVDTLISNYLRRGGNPNVAKNSDTVKQVKEGYGLIHALIAIRNTSALQKIMEAGAKTNVYPLTTQRQDKITPLVLAAKLGYMNGIRLLVEQGHADFMNARGPYGENALHAAVQSDSDDMVGYILRLCQNKLLDTPDNNGATPLHYACITGKTRWITLFIRDCHAKPDPKDTKGETPLHYAVRNRKLKVVMKLVGDLGVYPNPYIYKQVPTPLDLAKGGGLKTIADYLKRAGAKTTKEMEKKKASSRHHSVDHSSSNSGVLSGDSNTSTESHHRIGGGVRQFLHTKTSQMFKSTF